VHSLRQYLYRRQWKIIVDYLGFKDGPSIIQFRRPPLAPKGDQNTQGCRICNYIQESHKSTYLVLPLKASIADVTFIATVARRRHERPEQAPAHMLPCVWLLIPDLVASLTTDNNGDAREEDHATHGSDKSKLTADAAWYTAGDRCRWRAQRPPLVTRT